MTHTLHRTGNRDGLQRDYVILAIESQISSTKGRVSRFRAFADIVMPYEPVNFGDMTAGNMNNSTVAAIQSSYHENSIVHAVFTDQESVLNVLRELKNADIGLSIVVSGLLDETAECCRAADLRPHTIQYSLGVFGHTGLLPSEEIREISTMCGHGLVPFALIEKLSEEVRCKQKSPRDAAGELAKLCYCGIFNPARAVEILTGLTE